MTIEEALNKFGEKKIEDITQSLTSNNKVATGRLSNSLRYVIESNPEKLSFILTFFAEHYLINIHKGRKPGTYPNIDNIKEWMKARNIPATALYPIVRKIFDKGIGSDESLNDVLGNEKLLEFRGVLQQVGIEEIKTQLNNFLQQERFTIK